MKEYLIVVLGFIFSGSVYAQDYQISFTGSGQSSTVDSVQVTNLAQGTTATLMGSDKLYLVGTIGLHEITLTDNRMKVYPNPMNESSTIEFYNPNEELTTLLITDNIGKTLGKYSTVLGKGVQAFSIQGLRSGCYQINIRNSKVIYNTSLISVGNESSGICLKYERIISDNSIENPFKSSENLIQMQYNQGERLLFRGFSSNHARILTLVPTENQIVDFEFIECTDFDNNSYPVVTIGDQTWMAENLKVSHYRNGDSIPNVTGYMQWDGLNTGAYCWYDNEISWKDIFGALYNWYAVIDSRGLCPAGWHTPTNTEWTILSDYLGGISIAGVK
ncbi:MAG: fibrobacter succinogenes major paralogous domain-containing protein [Bacteroidales bacterium]|nr:fibrobacter succinogenes major paralogous domain-containing protein [Bacteroidales bacterium]